MPRILLTTAFKPFGKDGVYTRKDSFPEVFHNRITRPQGIFSYRVHLSTLGLHAIANNVSADCTVIDYPSYRRFVKEVRKGYDYVGIGSVMANLNKVRIMAETVRRESPKSKIVIGGYVAQIENVDRMMPLDHLCPGEGISFMRELLGDPPEYEFKNPDVYTRAHSFLGVPLMGRKNPQVVIGLGCPYGCEFCCPSHHFGRKYYRFFTSGEQIFRELKRLEKKFGNRTFGFHGDDNFLMDMQRADELRQCIKRSGDIYEIYYFASPDKAKEFGAERMAEMGTNILWLGRESGLIRQRKTDGVDMKALVEECHNHGIKVAVSSMLFMDHHDKKNIWEDVEGHIALDCDLSLFSIYSAAPGTPLYDRMVEEDRINRSLYFEDLHGFWRPPTFHPHFSPAEAQDVRERIVDLEYHRLGPGPMRFIKTDLAGYRYMKDSENPALRKKAQHLGEKMPVYRALLWAMARLAPTAEMRDMIEDVLAEVEKDFGPATSFEKVEGMGLWCFGTKEKIKQALFGDVIQPPTILTNYPGGT